MMRKVLIANRGEIAVRVIRACHEMGLATVALYSDADRDALHVRLADEAVGIGGPLSRDSYLNAPAVVAAAWKTKADAVHPGYGFLSENADFARRCSEAGLAFIGPSPQVIAAMGDKAAARRTVAQLGVPVVEGADVSVADPAEAARRAAVIGYPVLIKAAAGGGGRGMSVVQDPKELAAALIRAGGEAQAAFGDGRVYLERYIPDARHVEVQVFGDGQGRALHLFERDCSVQRRHQKLIEESPSPAIDDALRRDICHAAVRIAEAIRYGNAGTVEFLLDRSSRRFYFIEMNTRLQVEHPVTEAVTRVDLVREQLLFAATGRLDLQQEDFESAGHAIECRINAEDPRSGFRPAPGRITGFVIPSGPGIRVDTFCEAGHEVVPFYDSLLAKLIVHAPDRPRAIARMAAALRAFQIGGVTTTRDFHAQVMDHSSFRSGDYNTRWVESEFIGQETVA